MQNIIKQASTILSSISTASVIFAFSKLNFFISKQQKHHKYLSSFSVSCSSTYFFYFSTCDFHSYYIEILFCCYKVFLILYFISKNDKMKYRKHFLCLSIISMYYFCLIFSNYSHFDRIFFG